MAMRHAPAPGLALLLACAAGAPPALACQAPVPGLEAGALRSQWQEFDARGRPLVREQGLLQRGALTLELPCGALRWSAQWALGQGRRAYDGVSNLGQPVATASAIEASELALQGLQTLDAHWSWGLALRHRRLRREIAGSGAVLGYTERFSDWQAALVLRHERPLTPGTTLSASAWVGGGPGGRLALQLPRSDPAVLELGPSRWVRLALQIGRAEPPEPRPGWTWQLGLHYEKERMDAGPARSLVRGGQPAGAALQPRTVQSALGLQLSLRYRF